MKKRLTVPLLCLMLLLSGCTAGNAPDVRAGTPSPLSLSSPGAGGEVTARLYFRYGDTACLAGEERTLTLDRSQTAERVILQALLDGPQAQSASLTPLFPEGTRLLSVASADGTLFVTFSEELLGRYADETGDGDGTEKTLRRRLCMAALADTLTEAGLCDRVQVLVKREGAAVTSLRLPASFYRDTTDETPCGPIFRDESVLMTPHNSAAMILNAWMTRDDGRLYGLLSAGTADAPRPAPEEAYAAFDASPLLTSFTLTPGVLSADGQTAVLCARMTLRPGQEDVTVESAPVRLRLENGLWKIDFDQLTGLFAARD